MAWNKANANVATPTKSPKKSRKSLFVAVAVMAVVASVLSLWLHYCGNGEPPHSATRANDEKKIIAEAGPTVSPKPVQAATPQKKRLYEMSREEKLAYYKAKFGNDIPEALKQEIYYLKHPPQKTFKARGPNDFLRHPSERMIAGVVLQPPGTFFVMQPEFNESFNEDFAAALQDPIEIYDDDPENVRAVKEEMASLKKQIDDICKKDGRKPNEVMNEFAKSMFELGRFQRDLESELNRLEENPELSDTDVESFCQAANVMLEKKGLPALPIPDLTRRSIRLHHALKRAESKAARLSDK